jgi:hypothetical protein
MQSFNEFINNKEEQLFEEGKKEKKKGREWKTGKKIGAKGTVRRMLIAHSDKFSKKGGKGKGKLNPYAIASSMAKKGAKFHYKNQPSTLKGTPKKKAQFKNESFNDWLIKRTNEEKEHGWKQINDEREKKYGKIRNMKEELKEMSKKEQEAATKHKA